MRPSVDMRAKVVLHAVRGPLRGSHFEFTEADAFVFGRGLDCHGRIPENDPLASRYHFVLEVQPPHARVRDLGSLNGTVVNGKKLGGAHQGAVADLAHGDSIDVGATSFRVEIRQPAARVAATLDAETLLRDAPDSADVPPIAGYVFERRLGAGAMGAVMLARRRRDGRRLAMKLLLRHVARSGAAVRRFLREAELAVQLKHPHIVATHELGQAGGVLYVTMEICEGGSLDSLIERHGGKVPLATALPLMLQMLDGLQHAHEAPIVARLADGTQRRERGIVHRDLKPQNILLSPVAGSWHAKLSDYGLAKCLHAAGLSGFTRTGAVAGTPCFMPREQLLDYKRVGQRADVWSLGATFYNMLTGFTPLDFPPDRDPIAVILDSAIVPVRRRDGTIAPRLAEIIDCAIDRDPHNRFADARHFRRALAALV
jgi:serine/threonine protein kinase